MKHAIALALLGLIAAVALVGLINLDSKTGMQFIIRGDVVLNGGIYDQDGYVLFTKHQTRYQRLYNSIVAVAPDGRVVGTGPLSPGQYQLTLYGDWRNYDTLYLQIGFYDAVRPERNTLYDCAPLNTEDLQGRAGRRSSVRIPMDLYCNAETLQKASTLRYR